MANKTNLPGRYIITHFIFPSFKDQVIERKVQEEEFINSVLREAFDRSEK